MNHRKIKISIIMVLIWMGVIFLFSEKNTTDSNETSRNLIYNVTEHVLTAVNKIGISEIHYTEPELKAFVEKWNKPVRKLAHMSIYFVLGGLILWALHFFKISLSKALLITLCICFLYALTDEYHQTFVEGRTGQFTDCLIDTGGSSVACLIYTIAKKKKKSLKS